jgi:hypothetical protein
MTNQQKRNLAVLVLQHGYDVLEEFWGEVIEQHNDSSKFPPYEEAMVVLNKWHSHILDLADKA